VSDTETREARYARWSDGLLGTGITSSAFVPIVAKALELADEESAAARAEADRLRDVVEAVQALPQAWARDYRDAPPMDRVLRKITADLCAALAPVPSSGETGERAVCRCVSAPAQCELHPASGADEALGRIVREAWVEWAREQPDPKPHWLVGWDDLDAGQREVDVRIARAVLAARPVLSREALRERLNGHWPASDGTACACGWRGDRFLYGADRWRDHLAAVLDTQEADRG
jgi:hypothetical protein